MVILLSLGKATQPCPSPSAQTLLRLCPQKVPLPLPGPEPKDLHLRAGRCSAPFPEGLCHMKG